MTAPRLTLTLAASAVVAGFAALVLLLVPNPGSNAVAHAAPVARIAHPGGTAVSSTLDGDRLAPADAAFLGDLLDGPTDLPAQQATDLVAVAHRVCDLLAHPESVPPGADRPTREAMIETFTMPTPSLTTGWTRDQAGKFLDAAEAAYCPQVLAATYATPARVSTTAPAPAAPARSTAAPHVTPTPAPAAAPSAAAAPSTTADPTPTNGVEVQGPYMCTDPVDCPHTPLVVADPSPSLPSPSA